MFSMLRKLCKSIQVVVVGRCNGEVGGIVEVSKHYLLKEWGLACLLPLSPSIFPTHPPTITQPCQITSKSPSVVPASSPVPLTVLGCLMLGSNANGEAKQVVLITYNLCNIRSWINQSNCLQANLHVHVMKDISVS